MQATADFSELLSGQLQLLSYGTSESTTDLRLFQNTISENSTLDPIPNLEFKPQWTKIGAKLRCFLVFIVQYQKSGIMAPLRVLLTSDCFKTQFLKFLHSVQTQSLNLSHSGRKLEQNWSPEKVFRDRSGPQYSQYSTKYLVLWGL